MRWWTVTAPVAAVTVACAAVSGCTFNIGNPTGSGTAKVSKADLQKDISQRLADAGRAPQSVSCPDDLVGEVGKTMRCEVIVSATSSLEPIVTVTGVEGDKVDYDIAPAVSKTQLEKSVSLQVATSSRHRSTRCRASPGWRERSALRRTVRSPPEA